MDNIRNFCIIAHIDHGKSTLADRFLELTGIVAKGNNKQILDNMDLERERGITIKMQPVRMVWHYDHSRTLFCHSRESGDPLKDWIPHQARNDKSADSEFILNLIDTPGHTDFSYEVSRALAAVEGAILLVDATKSIQAQTLANLELAKKQNLKIIPVINKIDLPNARTEEVKKELFKLLDMDPSSILTCSAKTGEGVAEILEAVVKNIPAPNFMKHETYSIKHFINMVRVTGYRLQVFDSYYDSYQGVVAYIRVIKGNIKKGQKVTNIRTGESFEIKECGYLRLKEIPQEELAEGEIGYIKTGLKSAGECVVGDFISNECKMQNAKCKINDLFLKKPEPKVFARIFPISSERYPLLAQNLERLSLNDASFTFQAVSAPFTGSGFQIGCLGLLHLEIVKERLKREYGQELVITKPSVKYKPVSSCHPREGGDPYTKTWIPRQARNDKEKESWQEPWVKLNILSPFQYNTSIMEEMKNRRAILKSNTSISDNVSDIVYEAPMAEIITDFNDRIKSISQGYASFSYQEIDYRDADLTELDIYLAEEKYPPLSELVPSAKVNRIARDKVKKLKEALPRQLFELKIQARIDGKIIASERIPPLRKDVIAKLYGGDITRKKKLLEKQKKGKKKMQALGKIQIPTEVMLRI